ncbi:ribosome small subunit-dependent GTPase A [Fervidibacillus halotolerans]|uniref:Small ribosomal subunit biogenesis GTPase RsgA n=1 Tax=Fervidibacillus halotolerans TaxID=2980027 RepID=A0A9E8RYB8_9BACI|nr:ribosome small subunit-dependent GTPase A [Fervidibacillus halotolerans]WAA13650.1 ribosome small subunit-dependent GTPase A [Fervidibacillus halotolerans]
MPSGTIIKALSGFYYVKSEAGIVRCRGRGVFRKQNISPLVGDYVEYSAEKDSEGYITAISERKNELIRPPIANVDQAILVFSAKDPDLHTTLLDRFLVVIESKKIKPILVVTKMDLLTPKEKEMIDEYISVYRSIGYKTIPLSSKTGMGLEQIKSIFDGKVSVFAGQSGVGKSTLINALRPDLQLKTSTISKHLGRGKHTTRHVELLEISKGLVADTPGFSAIDFFGMEPTELSFYFPEIRDQMSGCKFRNCLHVSEPKCAVKEAVETEQIQAFRYQHYLMFLKEIQERKQRYEK